MNDHPFRVDGPNRMRDYSFPWYVRRNDKGPYAGLVSRHRSEEAAQGRLISEVRKYRRQRDENLSRDVPRDSDHCKACGGESLFSGFYDEDGLAVPDDSQVGWTWGTICNDCGELQG
jgi:hypothetical protein